MTSDKLRICYHHNLCYTMWKCEHKRPKLDVPNRIFFKRYFFYNKMCAVFYILKLLKIWICFTEKTSLKDHYSEDFRCGRPHFGPNILQNNGQVNCIQNSLNETNLYQFFIICDNLYNLSCILCKIILCNVICIIYNMQIV